MIRFVCPVLLVLVFGSATTLFYWTKWLGKMGQQEIARMEQEDAMGTNAVTSMRMNNE